MSLRPTIGLRLTAWVAALVLVGGAGLLTASYLLIAHRLDAYPSRVGALVQRLDGRVRHRRPSLSELPPRAVLAQQSRAAAEQRIGARTKHDLFLELSGLLLAFTVVAVGTGLLVTRRALTPVARITAAARRVGDGALGERLRLDGPEDELVELARTFDAMLDRIEGAMTRERGFIANASHELRTPLAVIQAEVDAARAGAGADPATARSLEVIEAAAGRSRRLLESLFALARAGRTPAARAPVDLRDLVESELLVRAPALAALEVRTRLAGASLDGDPTLLGQLVENLLDNAVRHAPQGGVLEVVTRTDGAAACLEIANDGPPLSTADAARLTEPFVRGAVDTPGLGLGLTLVESIVHAHGGALTLAPRPAGGLHVAVHMPSAPSVASPPWRPPSPTSSSRRSSRS